MPDFWPWVSTINTTDSDARALQSFASSTAIAGTWPATSNDLPGYYAAVTAAAPGPSRDAALTALGRLYERWLDGRGSGALQPPRRVGPGLIALVFTGLIIAAVLGVGMFYMPFLSSIAQPDYARGLITFLFSFATIGVFVLVAIAVFWLPSAEVEPRFRHAKDLITILVGVLGTVIGFYFGAASPSAPLSISLVTVPSSPIPIGSKVTATAKVSGGVAPYLCDIAINTPFPTGVDPTKMDLKCQVFASGQLSAEMTVPAGVSSKTEVTFKIVARDARGGRIESPDAKFSVP